MSGAVVAFLALFWWAVIVAGAMVILVIGAILLALARGWINLR